MEDLLDFLHEIKEYDEILKNINESNFPIMISGLFESQKAHIASGILKELDRPSIFIAQNEVSAKLMYEDLKMFLNDRVIFYPVKELVIYDIEAQDNDISTNRLIAIDKMINSSNYVLIISIEALLCKVMPREIFEKFSIIINAGERYDYRKISDLLVTAGYQYSHMVEGKGQFSIRGEILDIFPINSDNPYRIDFFDDQVESIKEFDFYSQRSISQTKSIHISAAREIIVENSLINRVINKIKQDLDNLKFIDCENEIYKRLQKKIRHNIEKIEQKIYFPGLENYINYFYNSCSLIDFLPDNGLIFIDEFNKTLQSANSHFEYISQTVKEASIKGQMMLGCINSFFNFDEILILLKKKRVVYLSAFLQSSDSINFNKVINIPSRPIPSFNGKIKLLIEDIKKWRQDKKKIVILAGSMAKASILVNVLKDNDILCSLTESLNNIVMPGEIVVTHGSLNRGFEYSSINFVVISDKEILGEEKKKRRRKKQLGQKIKVFSDLNFGDYVVHQVHGIGQYVGIEKLKVEGIIKDYFKIQYVKGDLFVPITQLDLIQKYIGSEGKKPKINRLGGTDWNKLKSKVKQSLQDIAVELINLYAKRQLSKGFAFSQDNIWQRQFEETFPYEETDDQLRCIEEAKSDMEKPIPMDRLLCGDVGYGKTEIAMRASFKAAMNSKQVAYLVPTTILASQHYNNFAQRMRDFPVRVEMLSRFRTVKEQKAIIKALKEGLIDILIGTHRILQKDVSFKDLGLVIVDEEQRFGVTHKEKLKMLKQNVDVLTLTATPIPRTLHMALIGVRDMSVINEPPEDRHPVQTFVLEHNNDFVKDAILREISRGGQVFYLHNRVASIHKVLNNLQTLVPQARIIYAHGQMSEGELEDIIESFLNKEYDVLVCTTIIESGLDMPNVNTIIIEDADKMGLSQLYQLRGRVGRAKKQAYAYFTFRKDKVLSEVAEKRLKAIKEFTEFGSGFKIAMRDLEIRGAGNLIGAEQHGHMNAVGYEMYCKLLEDTVREFKGEKIREEFETTIDVNVSAYIDESYIEDTNQKIEMYKKIAVIENEEDILDLKAEFIDRYGNMPIEVVNLMDIAYIKSLCTNLNISSISQKGNDIIIVFNSFNSAKLKIIGELSTIFKRRILFTASQNPYLTFKTDGLGKDKILDNIKILLQNLKNVQL